jgi:hypothetical protein
MPESEGVVAPVVPAVVAPVVPPTVTVADLPPEALRQRLEQAAHAAQTKLLADLGIADVAEAKAAIAAQRAAAEAQKTDAEKLAALNLRVTAQESALTVAVSQAAKNITAEQKAAVDAIAGTDSVTWLRTYAALAPTWGGAPVPVVPVAPAAPAAPAAPIITSTAPAAPAPAPTNQTSPADHATVYASLKSNPFAAAAYLEKYGSACYPKT